MTIVYIIGALWLATLAYLVWEIRRAMTPEEYAAWQRRKAIRRRRKALARNVIAAERLDELYRNAQEQDQSTEGEEHARDH